MRIRFIFGMVLARIVFFLIAFMLLFNHCSLTNSKDKQVKPNILLINIDDMGWRDAEIFFNTFFVVLVSGCTTRAEDHKVLPCDGRQTRNN